MNAYLGKAIKLYRTQRDMSQDDLAAASGISVSYLSLLEGGKRDPAFSTVVAIAKALRTPLCLLVFIAMDRETMARVNPKLAEAFSLLALRVMDA